MFAIIEFSILDSTVQHHHIQYCVPLFISFAFLFFVHFHSRIHFRMHLKFEVSIAMPKGSAKITTTNLWPFETILILLIKPLKIIF